MADIGTKEAAKRWQVTEETIRKWCREGKIKGVTQDKKGSPWHIPQNAIKPSRSKKNKGGK